MPICITGMHRSGTSMVARLLNLCGLYLGPEEDLLPAAEDNPEGFWENIRFVSINNRLLGELGGSWELPPEFPKGWERRPAIRQLGDEAVELVESFRGHGFWGWKDPRVLLTLPFWEEMIPDLQVVVCLRNPVEVAHSLAKRDSFSIPYGLCLWLVYYERLLACSTSQDYVLTHYDAYFHDARSELRLLLHHLNRPVSDEVLERACGYAFPSLRHNRVSLEDLSAPIVPMRVREVYRHLAAQTGPIYLDTVEQGPDAAGGDIVGLRSDIQSYEDALRALRLEALQGVPMWSKIAKTQIYEIHRQLKALDRAIAYQSGQAAERLEALAGREKSADEQIRALISRIDQLNGELQGHAQSIYELRQLQRELAGPIELVRLLTDAQHRFGISFTITSFCSRVRGLDQRLKSLTGQFRRRSRLASPDGMMNGQVGSRQASSADIKLHCDQPRLKVGARVGGVLQIDGWAIASRGVKDIEVFVDDTVVGRLVYGYARPDVRAAFPSIADAANSGFCGAVHLRSVAPGHHNLRLRVTDREGYWREVSGTIDLDPDQVGSQIGVPNLDHQYQIWLQQHALTEERQRALRGAAQRLTYCPTFSILMPVFNTAPEFLRLAIQSVLRQVYPQWELCIVDDGSTDPAVRPILEEFSLADPRIRILFHETNRGIAAATNTALQMATGEFIGLLDHDDELWPNALYECAKLLNEHPEADMLYSDEDKISPDGQHHTPFFKPDWSPDLLTSMMYTCHFSVFRRSLVLEIGGFRSEFDGSQDYDLTLRFTEKTDRIYHIPTILYSWRTVSGSGAARSEEKPYAIVAARRALEDALARRGIAGVVEPGVAPGRWHVRYRIAGSPSITLVIPAGGNLGCLAMALDSVLQHTEYSNFEVLVLDNSDGNGVYRLVSSRQETYSNIRYLEFRHRPFNFSANIDFAARHVTTPYIAFINDDVTVVEANWLEAMLEHAQRPEVGVVGAKLLYPDGSIQHAGVVLGIGGVAGHAFKRYPPKHHGPFHLIDVIRDVSAVTFACVVVRRAVFEEVGGLDSEHLPVAFNDVDFCLRVRKCGYRIVYTPLAVLHHHESATRHVLPSSFPGEVEFMQEVWGQKIKDDPYYNRNLSLASEDYSLAVVDGSR